ncbi:hypothetical protein AB0L71_15535 [Streptomyces sp. NPDC052052]|uniref:hypothetical protein n=1 Tax=Streptomyces sp. NPDC052052 TaxID=3154756 RepID=UPI0034319A52
MTFYWVWIAAYTAVLLPLAIASLRGWSPRWVGDRSVRAARARGVAACAIYASGLAPAVMGLAGVPDDGMLALRIAAGPCLLLGALALVARTSAAVRRARRTAAKD